MRKVVLFVEDFGHRAFLEALVYRFERKYNVPVEVARRSVRGGHGKVIKELAQYIRDLRQNMEALPDLLIVATDANCKGLLHRRQEIDAVTDKFKEQVVCAIPDPHIERWLLLDSKAFKEVLGKGCETPDLKCERDRYKQLLLKAIRDAGILPLLGGIEYAEDIVNAMDLQRMEQADASLGKLLKELHHTFKNWSED